MANHLPVLQVYRALQQVLQSAPPAMLAGRYGIVKTHCHFEVHDCQTCPYKGKGTTTHGKKGSAYQHVDAFITNEENNFNTGEVLQDMDWKTLT